MAATGNLLPFIQTLAQRQTPALSFLHDRFADVEAWRSEVREVLHSALLLDAQPVDLSPELVEQVEYDDYLLQRWYITTQPGERVPVRLLLPRGTSGPRPAIVGLHDHGNMYYFGKRKLVYEEPEPEILTSWRQEYYDGVPIANALARQGYIVAVIDAFYFGERRINVPPPDVLQHDFLLAAEGSDTWIELLNRVSAMMESTVAKSLFWAGATWPGILAWDDMRTVDFLLTMHDVDPLRIGCIGLSMGGMRAAMLGALDPRVKAVCVVGWMSTLAEMLEEHVALHAWCNFTPGLPRLLDWPDVAGLHAPNPLLVMQGSHDDLFPLAGYQRAAERLRSIYAKAGAPGNFDVGLFDVGHAFTTDMQRHAWAFFENAFARDEPRP